MLRMKKKINLLLLIIAVIPYLKIYSQEQWVRINCPTNYKLTEIFCLDSLTCWAAGDSGVIIHSTNGGTEWVIQNSGVTETIPSIFFINNNLGWAVSAKLNDPYGSYILKTTNGGELWEKEFFSQENNFLHAIFFLDSLNGWIGGSPSAFYGTTDGGISWKVPGFDSSVYSFLPVSSFNFFSSQYGFAVGGAHDLVGVIWRTTDYGKNWLAKPTGPEPLQKIFFIDSLNIVGVGGDFEYGTGIARTTDAGETWSYIEPGFLGASSGLAFRTGYEAWACLEFQKKFIFSNDSAKTWTLLETTNNTSIYDITFTDSLHGFAVGDSGGYSDSTFHTGVILKYKSNQVSSNYDVPDTRPSFFYLSQNYPNPFNPLTNIRYYLPYESKVSMVVYNVMGKEVAVLVNETKEAGIHEVEFTNRGELSSGVYFYTIRADNFTDTKKFILLK